MARLFAMTNRKNTAVLAAVTAATLMGTLGYFVRSSGCSAQMCAFVRFLTGLVLIAPVLVMRHGWRSAVRPSWMAAVSGVGISMCILFYFLAMQCLPLGIAALMVYVGPVLAAAAEAVWNRRLPALRDALPLAMSLVGIVAVAAFAGDEVTGGGAGISHQGLLYSFLSAAGYSVYLLLNSRIPAAMPLSYRTYWQFLAGCLVLSAAVVIDEGHAWCGMVQGWPYLLAIGVCHGLVVMMLISYAARRLSAIQYGTFAYLEPAVAVLMGYLLYAEEMTAGQWAGFALVLAAAATQVIFSRRTTAHLTKQPCPLP